TKNKNIMLRIGGGHAVCNHVHVLTRGVSRSAPQRSCPGPIEGSKTASGSWNLPADLADGRACPRPRAGHHDRKLQRTTRGVSPGASRPLAERGEIDPPQSDCRNWLRNLSVRRARR